MSEVIKIYPVGFGANCFLLTADGKNAVAIDPAQPRVLREAQKRGLNVQVVLLTHSHADHIAGVAALQRAGARVGCLEEEKELILGETNRRLSRMLGIEVEPFTVDFTLRDGEINDFCGMKIKTLATAGHTVGGCCYLWEDKLFSGDTLFYENIGRVDLPTGSGGELLKSLQKLRNLEGDYTVYTGHGEETTLSHERTHNGYMV